MEIVKLETNDCDYLLEKLKGKTFFAVTISNGDYEIHVPDFLTKQQIIFGLEVIRKLTMDESIEIFEEENK